VKSNHDIALHSGFQLSVDSSSRMLCFCFSSLNDWLKNSRHFLNQSQVNPKPNVTFTTVKRVTRAQFARENTDKKRKCHFKRKT